MIRSLLNAVRRSTGGFARARGALALAPALLLLTAPLPSNAAPPSQIVEEHLVAQAGLSVGFTWSAVAQFFGTLAGTSSTCTPAFGGTNSGTLGLSETAGSTGVFIGTIFFDGACQKPYFVSDLQVPVDGVSFDIIASTAQMLAPNGAVLGVFSQAQEFQSSGSTIFLNSKGTYKAVAGVGQPPVRTGLGCTISSAGASDVFSCHEGVAQDFPALKMSLGTIANITLVLTQISGTKYSVVVSGSTAKLATGKLGGLSITTTGPSSIGFQGQATIVGGGSTSGSSPVFGAIPPASTTWTFNDAPHVTKFSISTASNQTSSGKVIDTTTHATLATFEVDESGTGTITYSDKSKAKITNWTLSD